MRKILLTALFIISISQPLAAKHKHTEKYYQEKWCSEHGGITEYVLPDRTRVDCLTKSHAYEFDFGNICEVGKI